MTRVSVISPNSFITQHLQSNRIESTKGVAEFNEAAATCTCLLIVPVLRFLPVVAPMADRSVKIRIEVIERAAYVTRKSIVPTSFCALQQLHGQLIVFTLN